MSVQPGSIHVNLELKRALIWRVHTHVAVILDMLEVVEMIIVMV